MVQGPSRAGLGRVVRIVAEAVTGYKLASAKHGIR
jgi:hypothetical protein